MQRSVQTLLEIRKSPECFQSRQAGTLSAAPASCEGDGSGVSDRRQMMEVFFESTKNKSSRERMTRRARRRCSSFGAVISRVRRQWRGGGGGGLRPAGTRRLGQVSELSGFAALVGVNPGHVIPSSHGPHGSILIHLNVTFVFSSRPETNKRETSHGDDDDGV